MHTEPEFTSRELALLLAHERIEAERGSHGISMREATDPANQFNFVTQLPVVDWAAHTLEHDKSAWYKQHDTDKDNPMNRAGHLWSVRLKTE